MKTNFNLEIPSRVSIMLRELTIYFIYADKCKDCDDMRATINDAIANSSYDPEHCKIVEINSEKDEAIDLAVENDINDLPACVIGNFVFCGKDGYSYEAIFDSIEKTWEEDSGTKDNETHRNIY